MRSTIHHTHELDDYHEIAHDFQITGRITAHIPASMYGGADQVGHPAEGGEIEDLRVSLERVHFGTREWSALLEPHRAQIESEFLDHINACPQLREQIENELRAAADRADEAAYEGWLDEHDRQRLPLEEHP